MLLLFRVQPCFLYFNIKAGEQQMFAAAAALWDATGEAAYRADVDRWWAFFTQERPFTGFTFLQVRVNAVLPDCRAREQSLPA